MEQPAEMVQALLSASSCILFFLFQRYEPFKGWRLFKVLSLGMGIGAAIRLSQAFDPPHHMSLRSQVVDWAVFAIVVLLVVIGWARTARTQATSARGTL